MHESFSVAIIFFYFLHPAKNEFANEANPFHAVRPDWAKFCSLGNKFHQGKCFTQFINNLKFISSLFLGLSLFNSGNIFSKFIYDWVFFSEFGQFF